MHNSASPGVLYCEEKPRNTLPLKNASVILQLHYKNIIVILRFSPSVLADFRPGSRFSTFRTEVLVRVSLQTSVSDTGFRRLGRKSFPSVLADFRPRHRFSTFRTEVDPLNYTCFQFSDMASDQYLVFTKKNRDLHILQIPV